MLFNFNWSVQITGATVMSLVFGLLSEPALPLSGVLPFLPWQRHVADIEHNRQVNSEMATYPEWPEFGCQLLTANRWLH